MIIKNNKLIEQAKQDIQHTASNEIVIHIAKQLSKYC